MMKNKRRFVTKEVCELKDILCPYDLDWRGESDFIYIWDRKRASLFIDSILQDLPFGRDFIVGLHEKGDFTSGMLLDGFHRLETVLRYTFGEWLGGQEFRLSCDKNIYHEWRGKAFKDLNRSAQDRIMNCMVEVTYLVNYDMDELHEYYLRLHTGE